MTEPKKKRTSPKSAPKTAPKSAPKQAPKQTPTKPTSIVEPEDQQKVREAGLERVLSVILSSHCKHGTNHNQNLLIQSLLKKYTGHTQTNLSCGRCVYSMYEEFAKIYFPNEKK